MSIEESEGGWGWRIPIQWMRATAASARFARQPVLDFILRLHLYTYYQILVTGLLATVWGVVMLLRRAGLTDGFRSALYLVGGTGVVQAVLGGTLFLAGLRPNNILHLVYGLIALIGIPVAFVLVGGDDGPGATPPSPPEGVSRRDIGILTFAAFAIFAAALRAYATGVPK